MPKNQCPSCGAPLPAHALGGRCPRCLLLQGLDSEAPGPDRSSNGHTLDLPVKAASVLDTIGSTIGGVPRVLLRDTTLGETPGPIIRPDGNDVDTSIRYRIDGEIARGGMGAVLKGRDPDLGRDVALKVLREDLRGNPDMVRRFVEEAQISGQLQHPGIVPIYELGQFADHRPFFSMKLVKGHTLAALLSGRKDPASGLPRFLSIVEAVTQTVAYAHARGVIHRDLKPSNVMVGSFGEVQVMDWGLAKVLPRGGASDDDMAGLASPDETVIATARSGSADSDLSHPGSIMGTPSYMAPEQARGEIGRVDERADVFALGSILCEVLTGQPAFVGRSAGEIQRKAALGDLADALRRLDGCGAERELAALAKDCLAREPEDRPRDSGAVTGRLTEYLSGVQERLRRAELARAAEAARAEEAGRTAEAAEARARAERRARRMTVALAASILVLVFAGGGVAAWLAQQRQARALEVLRQLDLADSALDRAGREEGPAASGAAEEARLALARAEGLTGPRPDPVTATHVRSVQERFASAARLRSLLADLEAARLGRLDVGVGPTDAAYLAAFRRAGHDPDRDGPRAASAWASGHAAVELASYLDDWSFVRRAAERPDADWLRLTAAAGAADPDPWREALRARAGQKGAAFAAAVRALADDKGALDTQPATSLVLLARQLKYGAGDLARAVRTLEGCWRRHPGDFWVHVALAQVPGGAESGTPGEIYPRPEEAVRHLTAALAIRPDSAACLINLGIALEARGRPVEAEAANREAIRLQPDSALAYNSLGTALRAQGKPVEAEAAHRVAIRLQPDFGEVHSNLGNALDDQGKFAEAEAAHREAIRLKPDLGDVHAHLGVALLNQGKLAEAEAAHREAIRLKPNLAIAHNNLAYGLMSSGDLAGAMRSVGEALRLEPENGLMQATLAEILLARGRFAEAVTTLERAARRLAATGQVAAAANYERLIPPARWLAGQTDALGALVGPVAHDGLELTTLDLAARARSQGLPALAARLAEVALAASPTQADDLRGGHRAAAACAAALAGSGGGKDDPPPDDAERAKLRRLAFGGLKADLAARSRLLGADPKSGPDVRKALEAWRQDPDLAGVRDSAALDKLPEAERPAWRTLWAEVDALLKEARITHP